MNDPVAVESLPGAADSISRGTPAGFGYTLAQARVRAGLSIEQAAARIRLHPKQLQAIENEDLQLLPAAAYVNGFVRNYAREIGIDPGPLIDDLNAKLKLRGLADVEPDLGPSGPMPSTVMDDRGWRHLVLAGIVIALVCAGVLGFWIMRSSERAGDSGKRTSASPPSLAPGAGALAASQDKPAAGADLTRGTILPPPTESSPAATPAAGAEATEGATASAPGAALPVGSAGSTAEAASAAGPGASAGVPSETPGAPAPGAKEGRLAVATMPPPAGATNGLLLRFVERSWVEVSQPDGRVLLSHIGEPGSIELVNASAPLVLVIGRADAVKVEYRGQPVNLKPYVNSANGVARVMLAEGDAASGGQNNR
jgi:cytoskeleton protein RodZ